jgi:hypothetical protein
MNHKQSYCYKDRETGLLSGLYVLYFVKMRFRDVIDANPFWPEVVSTTS